MTKNVKTSTRTATSGSKPSRSAAELEAILNAIDQTQGLVELGADGEFVTANETFANLTGYSVDELEGKRIFSLLTEASVSALRKVWDELRHTDQAQVHLTLNTKTGTTADVDATVLPWLDKTGRLTKVTVFAVDTTTVEEARQKLSQFSAAVDGTQTAMMMVDRDFVVTYANKRTFDMLRANLDEFRKVWPNFNPDALLGTCIDIFHKNPKHQRDLLADASRLPYQTRIEVGPMKFALQVSAQRDAAGNYVGNVLEWSDITEQCKQELLNSDYRGYFAAIDRSQAVIEFEMDGTVIGAND
ncbi:MAG: PAS domain S-box protein, partial [Planctomycetales bacterium]|nr:PAS domain S-box protein [Planctomycetales bacterium]